MSILYHKTIITEGDMKEETGVTCFRLTLPTKRKLRIAAARADKNVTEVLVELVEKFLAGRK